MNETMKILLGRSSVRTFTDQKIEKEILNNILDAGLHAASAGNLQPISIIKIEDPKNAQWFVDNQMQSLIAKAPLNLLFCLDFHRLKKWSIHHKGPFAADKSFRHFWVGFQDVIIAAQSIETAANSYGIGSVYIGTTVDMIKEIKERFNLPQGVLPIVLLTLGYPKTERRIANKLSKEIVVHNEQYQEPSIDLIEKEYYKKYGDDSLDLNEERVEQILEAVKIVEGEDMILEAREYLKTLKKVKRPTWYFTYKYPARLMASDNTGLLDILAEDGFIWANRENHPAK